MCERDFTIGWIEPHLAVNGDLWLYIEISTILNIAIIAPCRYWTIVRQVGDFEYCTNEAVMWFYRHVSTRRRSKTILKSVSQDKISVNCRHFFDEILQESESTPATQRASYPKNSSKPINSHLNHLKKLIS